MAALPGDTVSDFHTLIGLCAAKRMQEQHHLLTIAPTDRLGTTLRIPGGDQFTAADWQHPHTIAAMNTLGYTCHTTHTHTAIGTTPHIEKWKGWLQGDVAWL